MKKGSVSHDTVQPRTSADQQVIMYLTCYQLMACVDVYTKAFVKCLINENVTLKKFKS